MTRGLFRLRRRREDKSGVTPERGVYRPRFRRRSGGVTRIIRDNYGPSKAYHVVVQEVLDRDGRRCAHVMQTPHGTKVCGSTKNLEVHHIVPLSKGGKTEKANMITLCEDHHNSRHSHLAMGR